MVYKVWTYISIFVIAGIAFIPTQTDSERYEREIEIVAARTILLIKNARIKME